MLREMKSMKKTLNAGQQKVQFNVKISVHKEAHDNEEASDVDIYPKSEMTTFLSSIV